MKSRLIPSSNENRNEEKQKTLNSKEISRSLPRIISHHQIFYRYQN